MRRTSFKEVDENFAAYCTPLIPCIRKLQKVVFPVRKRWLGKDQQLYSRMKSVLQKARNGLDTIVIAFNLFKFAHFYPGYHGGLEPARDSSV